MIKRKLNNKIKTNDSSKDKKDNKDDSKDVNKEIIKIIVQTITSNNLIQMQQTMTKIKRITSQTVDKRLTIKNQVTLHHIMDKTQRQWLVKFIHLMVINHKHYNNCLISKRLLNAANNEANKFGNGHKVYNDYSIEEHNGNYKYVFSFKDPNVKWKIFNCNG